VDDPVVTGWCDPAFVSVRDEFSANFRERGELGAAVCVTVRGTTVASLQGGWADRPGRRPWTPDTLVNVFSVGKGLIAACTARLTGAGLLDPDAAVTRYWPQFGAAGKQDVTVRQLLSHQAGLPALHAALPAGSMLDFDRMVTVLAAEEPWWPPGRGHGYHVNTFGFLAGQLIRLVTGLLPGEYLTRELAGPLGADVHIGLRPEQQRRVADFHWPDSPPGDPHSGLAAGGPANSAGAVPDDRMTASAYFNPPDFSGRGVVNTAAWRGAQLPSANAHATAAGIARLYSALAAGGTAGGLTVADSGALAEATRQQVYGDDLVLRRPSRFGLGFQLTHPERQLGSGPRCFGHFGAGGSVGFADPDAQLAFGYVTNQMGPRWRNPRNKALMDAAYSGL
jgi:CubicO group peptidase (beta-lactamase class C family)